jgi:nucleoside-diphosphate-sugar epimerase
VSSRVLPKGDLAEITHSSKEVLSVLEGAKIVILGGTGFVGKWLVSALNFAKESLNLEYDLYVVTRSRTRAQRELGISNIKFIEHDLASSILTLPNADFYIHGATPSVPSTGSKDLVGVANSTLNGSLSIFNAALKSKNTKSILYLSSGAVYGKQTSVKTLQPEGPAKLPNPTLSFYGHTKLIGESICAQINLETGIPISTPRLFAFFGPHISLNDHFAIGNFLRDAREGKSIRILGNPKTIRSYLYPTDLISNLLKLIVHPQHKPINIGSSIPLTLLEVAKQISKMFGRLPIEILGTTLEKSNYVPETVWMQKEQGVRPSVPFEEGMLRWNTWLDQS